MLNNIMTQVFASYTQTYYTIETNKRMGIDYYINEKPVHRSSCDGIANLCATVYINDEYYHINKIPLSEINIIELLNNEHNKYDEYIYMYNSFFYIY